MKKSYQNITLEEILSTLNTISEEYGSFIDYDCQDEILEKFFDECDKKYTLQGMTKTESTLFYSSLETITYKIITKMMSGEEIFV